MRDFEEPPTFLEEPLTDEMRRLLRRQILTARVFGYPASFLLGALTLVIVWLLLTLETLDGFNPWIVLTGVLLVAVCAAMTWSVGYATRAQVRAALADLTDGMCVRASGRVYVTHESVRVQMFPTDRYILQLDTLSFPIDLYAVYALEGVEHAVVTYTRHTRRVLIIRTCAGDLLFSTAGLNRLPASGALAL